MKSIKKLILKFWFWLFPKQVIQEINETLADYKMKTDHEAALLLYEIRDYMKEEFNITDISKYIPLNVRNRAAQDVQEKYGKQLKNYRLKVTNELRFVKT